MLSNMHLNAELRSECSTLKFEMLNILHLNAELLKSECPTFEAQNTQFEVQCSKIFQPKKKKNNNACMHKFKKT